MGESLCCSRLGASSFPDPDQPLLTPQKQAWFRAAESPSVCCQIREDYRNLDSESKSKVHITLSLQGGKPASLNIPSDVALLSLAHQFIFYSGQIIIYRQVSNFPHNLLSFHLDSGALSAD